MKPNLILSALAGAILCACSPSGSSDSSSRQNRAESTEPAHKENEADWQLGDDSVLNATLVPWPPKEGAVQLKVEVTADDNDRKFAGTLDYRVATSQENSEVWKAMPKVREDQDKSVHFAVPLTLDKGVAFLQFRVRDKGEREFQELTDWKLKVK